MQCGDVMSPNPVTVSPDESIALAIDAMQSMNVRHLPVVDSESELVGMVSDRDISTWLMPYFRDPEDVEQLRKHATAPVSTIMTSAPLTLDIESESSDAAMLMIEHRIGAIPVVDAEGAVVGIVSYVDLLREYARLETEASR